MLYGIKLIPESLVADFGAKMAKKWIFGQNSAFICLLQVALNFEQTVNGL